MSDGACSGHAFVTLGLSGQGSDIFARSEPGHPANVVLSRRFSSTGPGTPSCPAECEGDFVVDLTRL